jgi:hypothetical protein
LPWIWVFIGGAPAVALGAAAGLGAAALLALPKRRPRWTPAILVGSVVGAAVAIWFGIPLAWAWVGSGDACFAQGGPSLHSLSGLANGAIELWMGIGAVIAVGPAAMVNACARWWARVCDELDAADGSPRSRPS